MGIRPELKSLVKVRFLLTELVLPPIIYGLVLPPSPDKVLTSFLWYSGLRRTHWTYTKQFSLHLKYYLTFLVLCLTPPFGSSRNQHTRSLVYPGYPLVEFLLYLPEALFKSYISFWDAPTKAMICASLVSFVDHLS